MPPRYVYWTILIDQQPTAFRAKNQEDLLPTVHQLRRTNRDVMVKWFARGKLWESPDAEHAAQRKPKSAEKRGPDWRPGGLHKDPRARFDKRKRSEYRPTPDAAQILRPADAKQTFKPANTRRPSSRPFRSGPPRPRRDRRK